MRTLIVSLTLGFLSLSRDTQATNDTVPKMGRIIGNCEFEKNTRPVHILGGFTPRCDTCGNYLPQQCSGSTGNCWCVNVYNGQEIPNTRTPPGTLPVDCYQEVYCPYGWTRYGKQCFIFIESAKSWIEAEYYCQFEMANLASIHSYEENRFVQALTKGTAHSFQQTWIGGHDTIYENNWMWSDGSKFNYENWSQYKYDMGHCLMMNYGYKKEWNCFSCNRTLPFVCAKMI